MPRYFKKTTLDEFKEKVAFLFTGEDPIFPYGEMPKKIMDDLSKVEFDFENYEIGDARPGFTKYDLKGLMGYPVGFRVLKNEMPCLFINAGGDWESPICFVLYWDGKQIRAYIPDYGNVWNKELKSAYGNNMDDNEDVGDEAKILADIQDRIQEKL